MKTILFTIILVITILICYVVMEGVGKIIMGSISITLLASGFFFSIGTLAGKIKDMHDCFLNKEEEVEYEDDKKIKSKLYQKFFATDDVHKCLILAFVLLMCCIFFCNSVTDSTPKFWVLFIPFTLFVGITANFLVRGYFCSIGLDRNK